MYDWANSAYSTLSITVLVSYLQGAVLKGNLGVLVWGWGIGLTGLAVAIMSPALGAIADAHGNKRGWLAGTAWMGAIASTLMIFATPDRPWLLVGLFVLSQIGIELSYTFYNGFLPEIASEQDMDRVSAYGYTMGYLGGGLALLGFLMLFRYGDRLGLPSADSDPDYLLPRLGLMLMGLWWGVFTLPIVLMLRDRSPPLDRSQSLSGAARTAMREVSRTLRHVRTYHMLTIFLLGFLFYNDGVQTIISQASVFAKQALEMKPDELVLLVLMIQFVAAVGSAIFGRLASAVGQKRALQLCLVIWIGLLVAAYFTHSKPQFWVLGAFVALVLGGTQSISRSIMGTMTPPAHTAEFFGFFNLSGKAISFMGPIVFSTMLAATGSPHTAIFSLLAFFIIGWLFIWRLDVGVGRQQAARVND